MLKVVFLWFLPKIFLVNNFRIGKGDSPQTVYQLFYPLFVSLSLPSYFSFLFGEFNLKFRKNLTFKIGFDLFSYLVFQRIKIREMIFYAQIPLYFPFKTAISTDRVRIFFLFYPLVLKL